MIWVIVVILAAALVGLIVLRMKQKKGGEQ